MGMIKVNKIISPEGQIIGVGIMVNNESYFASVDQDKWEGMRVGRHPRHADESADTYKLSSFKEEEIFSIPTNGGKDC